MSNSWTRRTSVDGVACHEYWERSDGYYVWLSKDQYYSNPLNPNCRMWMAFDKEDRYLAKKQRKNSIFVIPRKWNSAESAMKAVDKEILI